VSCADCFEQQPSRALCTKPCVQRRAISGDACVLRCRVLSSAGFVSMSSLDSACATSAAVLQVECWHPCCRPGGVCSGGTHLHREARHKRRQGANHCCRHCCYKPPIGMPDCNTACRTLSRKTPGWWLARVLPQNASTLHASLLHIRCNLTCSALCTPHRTLQASESSVSLIVAAVSASQNRTHSTARAGSTASLPTCLACGPLSAATAA
jgi:hypothetical protein